MSLTEQKYPKEKEEELRFNFINSIKSDVTKQIYEYNLKLFMIFCY